MAYDGSLKFDTKLDDSGLSDGITKLSTMAAKGLAAVTGALAGMSSYAIKVGADFEAGMSEVAAISGASGEDLEMLTEKAKEMGIQTKFSATEASEAMKYMAMAGWKATDMAEGISGIMSLAAASGEDLASVSDIVTDALTAFGLQAADSGHFADVLAKAASNSNTNVGLMGATFKYAAPLAGSLKYSIEDTAVAIGLMANAGIKGEQAGTALRAMLTRVVKPTDEVEGAMNALGISITNSDGTVKPFLTTIKDLRKSFSKLTDEEKANKAAAIAGQEAMSGFLSIVNASDKDFEKLVSSINDADGAAQDMAKTMNNNLKGKVKLLGSSLEGLGIAAYEKFERPMKKAVDGAIDKVNDLSDEMTSGSLSESTDKVAEGIGAIVDVALNLATDAIPLLIDGFAFMVDHGKEVVTILSGIGAAMITQKTIVPMVNAFRAASTAVDLYNVKLLASSTVGLKFSETLTLGQAMVGLFTGKVTLATAATTAWNAACSALGGPIGVTITAVAALGVGLVALCTALNDTSPLEKHKKAVEEAKESYNDLKQSHSEMLQNSLSNVTHYDNLKNKLDQIVDSSGHVKKGYEGLAGYIMNELNDALGMNLELINNQIIGYDRASIKMDEYLAKMRAAEIVKAQEETMKQANELYKQNNQELAALNDDYLKAKQEFDKQKKIMDDKGIAESERYQDYAYALAKTSLENYEKQRSDLMEVQKGIIEDQQTLNENRAALQEGGIENYKKISATEIATFDEEGNRIVKSLRERYDELLASISVYEEMIKNEKDEKRKAALQAELEDLNKQKTDIETQLEANTEAMVNVIGKGIPSVIGKYEETGDASLKAMDISKEAEKTSLKNVGAVRNGIFMGQVPVFISSQNLAQSGLDGVDSLSYRWSELGENASQGYSGGISSPKALLAVGVAAANMVQVAIGAALQEQKSHSPSRIFRDDIGLMAGAGYAIGLDKSQNMVRDSARGMVDCALDEVSGMNNLLQANLKGDFSASFDFLRYAAEQNMSILPISVGNSVYNTFMNESDHTDYDALEKMMTRSFRNGVEGMTVSYNGREMGRMIKEWS